MPRRGNIIGILKKITGLITGRPQRGLVKKITERSLIERESEIGRELFGPIPAGHKREFFCLDPQTWVWHEEWRDENNTLRTSTTRYEVQPGGILKVQPGRVYKYLEGEELENLGIAVKLYYERCAREIYGKDPYTGRPLDSLQPATIYS